MRVLLVSNISGPPDEGIKKVAFHLSEELSKGHQVKHVNARKVFSLGFWRDLGRFRPQIVHSFLRPSLITFLIVGALKARCPRAKIVLSALQPPLHYPLLRRMLPLLKVDAVLVQSEETERAFSRLGCPTRFLTSGVDTKRFTPINPEAKAKLREKYSLDREAFLILHVGHINRGRNLHILERLQEAPENQVLLIASTTFKPDPKVYRNLVESGCLLWRQYLPQIEEIYALSDCYVFPTTSRSHSIEVPLSVMEALSCNLPVLSTRFGGLPKLLQEGEGLAFVEGEEGFLRELEILKKGKTIIKTRDKVLSYTWEKVAQNLEALYTHLVGSDG